MKGCGMHVKHLALALTIGIVSSFSGIEEVQAKNSKVINDSLVNNLSCQKLSVESIYSAIRDDAFDESRNMPIKNWGFQSGLASLAGCWALSSTQRMVAYLGRYYVQVKTPDAQVPEILDMVRGRRLVEADFTGREDVYNRPYDETRLKDYVVFPMEHGSLAESARVNSGLWSLLQTGYAQKFRYRTVTRKFRDEVEANQSRHFFRVRNLGMGLGSGVRSEKKNARTINEITNNLDRKRLTLINLRAGQLTQHIVMAKSYSHLNSNIIAIKVYDSNQPSRDQLVYYDIKRKHFYAPDIVGLIDRARASYAVGTFVVDEEEREPLEKALLAHYQQRCR